MNSTRLKGDIEVVGSFDDYGHPFGWTFGCRGEVPPVVVTITGETLYAGYTLAELREIHSRPNEFLKG